MDGSGPVSLATGDFNGDGKIDLAAAANNSGVVSIILGNGDGTFQAAIPYPVGTKPRFLLAGEFNGDGRADLIVLDEEGNSAAVLLGASLTMTATGGATQSAIGGIAFADPLAVTVLDGATPVGGVIVSFTSPSTGATLSSPAALTDASGVASVTATAKHTVGSYTVTASAGSLTAAFNLTNTLGPAAVMTAENSPQSAPAGAAFAKPLNAIVMDAGGNPLSGVTVTFSAPVSGASAALSSGTAVTDASGAASVTATANATPGSYNVTATAGSLSTTFSLTNQAPAGIVLTVTPGNSSVFGAQVVLTAALTPASATGKVMAQPVSPLRRCCAGAPPRARLRTTCTWGPRLLPRSSPTLRRPVTVRRRWRRARSITGRS
jgi:hypothetical protein